MSTLQGQTMEMDLNAVHVTDVSTDLESESSKHEILERNPSYGEITVDQINASEVVTTLELNVARSSEKLINLGVLLMHVATRENEFEAYASKEDQVLVSDSSVDRILEFDLLTGILDCEVNELDKFMGMIKTDIIDAREMISSSKKSEESFVTMEEILIVSEESLKESQNQASEIRIQTVKLQRTLSHYYEGNWNGQEGPDFQEENQFHNIDERIKMQTVEEKRNILRMLEKSLEKEMDLEKKLAESRQIEEELKLRFYSSDQNIYPLEGEIINVWERCFLGENSSEVLNGVSKELLGRLQILQFHLNGSLKREADIRLKLEGSMEESKIKGESAKEAEREKVSLIEKKLKETKPELDEKVSEVSKAEEKVDSLERQLRESDTQLQQAMASVEASQEKESMLTSTIADMENLIETLRLKVSKAENHADNTEEKCIQLSESHVVMNNELRFLQARVDLLEVSLRQAEEIKMTTTKEINALTKFITDLVMQLAVERDRLQKKMSSLARENKILVAKLEQTNKDSSVNTPHENGKDLEHDLTTPTRAISKVSEDCKDAENGKTEVEPQTARRIDAGVSSFMHVIALVLVVLISIGAYNLMTVDSPY